MAKSKTTKVISKKHIARLERERRQTRILTIGSIIILAIVFISILYAVLNDTVFLNYKPIVTVNGEKVTVREFQVRVKVARQQLIDQFIQYYQMAQMFGMDPNTDSSLASTFDSISSQLENATDLGRQVLTIMENDLLMKQYAQANGIVVTSEEVEKAIRDAYRYYPDGTPTPAATATPLVYSTLSAAQLNLITATPTLTPTLTATPAPTNTPAPTITPFPTATPLTEQAFNERYQEGLDYYKNIGMSEEMFKRVFFEYALYREKIKAAVTVDVPHEEEQVWARHILVADEETANMVQTMLLAGGDFASLAAKYSLDTGSKDNGGDLGWFGRGVMLAEFETAAFSQAIGEIGKPVQSLYGYHIIQVLGHETRPLTAEEYEAAEEEAFNLWLEQQRAAATITRADNWESYVPAKPTLQEAFLNMFATQTALAPTYLAEQQTYQAELALTPSATPLPPTPTATP